MSLGLAPHSRDALLLTEALFILVSAGLVRALCWWLSHTIGGYAGVGIVFAALVAAALGMFLHSRKTAINATNVNADWEGGLVPASERREQPERQRVEA